MAPSNNSKKKAPGRTSSGSSKEKDYKSGPPLAQLALDLTSQEWSQLSMDRSNAQTAATDDLDVLVERVTALLLVRIVACVAVSGTLPDASTTMICKTYLEKRKSSWPKQITDAVMQQLKTYVRRILSGYQDIPYHNRQHAYHVILSVNKLVDMMACCYTHTDGGSKTMPRKFKPPPSFGLRNSPIAMLCCLFAALIHDVEHQGINNRQLSSENDRLAVLYNDQSIAENWSLYIAFSEFLQDEFIELREVLFGSPIESDQHKENYRSFRKMVVGMVLSTDIACPVRTQVSKSKWKEAFGEPHETVEAKLKSKRHLLQRSQLKNLHMRHSSTHSQGGGSVTSGSSAGIIDTIPQKLRPSSMLGVRKPSQGSDLSDEEDNDEDDLFDIADEGPVRETPPMHQHRTNTSTNNNNNSTPRSNTNNNIHIDSVDEGDETSLSGTPEHSEVEEHVEDALFRSPKQNNKNTGSHSSPTSLTMSPEQQRATIVALDATSSVVTSTSDHPRLSQDSAPFSLHQFLNKSERRLETRLAKSSQSNSGRRFRQRLGILRTVDLGGETLETYSRHTITDRSTSTATIAYSVADIEMDEPDELKMTVVMETILTVGDVAHNLQSWEHMIEWSRRLYLELRRAHVMGRGNSIAARNWFENQISFLESYILPLARRLEDTGVWGDEEQLPGKLFAHTVESMRDEWMRKGKELSMQLIQEGEKFYPMQKGELKSGQN